MHVPFLSNITRIHLDLPVYCVHVPGSSGLSQSWTSTQTGDDYPQNRAAYAPLYVDIEGIADHAQVILSALLDGEISILVAFATKIVKQHP